MNYYYSIVSIEFLINVEGTINFEIEGEILGQAFLSAMNTGLCCFCYKQTEVKIEIDS